jgi:hypothetical protein
VVLFPTKKKPRENFQLQEKLIRWARKCRRVIFHPEWRTRCNITMAVTTEQFKERLYTFWRRLDVNLVKPVAKTLGIEIPKRTTAREVVLKIVDATIQAGFDFILSDLGVEGTTLFTTCLGGDCGIFAEKLTTNDFIEVINEFSPTNTKEMAAFMMPEMDLLDLTLAQLRESIAAEFVLAGVATVLDKLDDATFKAVHATYINVDLGMYW